MNSESFHNKAEFRNFQGESPNFHNYTRYHEMPQKACERGFCHVIAFSQFFEMPQNRDSENRKNGAFQKIRT